MESQGVQITYLVKYFSEFWNDTQTSETYATNYTFHELHAGTNYNFEVRVKAGTQESKPTETSQTTSKLLTTSDIFTCC